MPSLGRRCALPQRRPLGTRVFRAWWQARSSPALRSRVFEDGRQALEHLVVTRASLRVALETIQRGRTERLA